MQEKNKWLAMLQSRKFWAATIGIAVAVGMLEFSDTQQAELIEAIVVIVGTIGYILGLSLEDGLTKVAASQEKIAEAQRMTRIQDAIKEYNAQQRTPRMK